MPSNEGKGMEWLLVIKGLLEALNLATTFADLNKGAPPTADQIAAMKAKRSRIEEEWESLAP